MRAFIIFLLSLIGIGEAYAQGQFLTFFYTNIVTNGTTVIKSLPGILHTITINTKGASSNVVTLYDGITTAGTAIMTVDTTSAVTTIICDCNFNTGLTAAETTGTAANATISWR